MISICIPIYNRDVRKLVSELYWQAEELNITCEIILLDDASSDVRYQIKNRELKVLPNVIYEELSANIGRSAIRNRLADKATQAYLLFIDSDTKVSLDNYLSNYMKVCHPGVVCYGSYNYEPNAEPKYYLRWLFGTHREAIPIDVRMQNPNKYFSSFNFFIDKSVFQEIRFDNEITEYGYEDVLFQIELLKKGYTIIQLNNPLTHLCKIENKDFIIRTESAVRNLYKIGERTRLSKQLEEYIRLFKAYKQMSRLGLKPLAALSFKLFKRVLTKNLSGNKPSLFFLDLYKLGYLCSLK